MRAFLLCKEKGQAFDLFLTAKYRALAPNPTGFKARRHQREVHGRPATANNYELGGAEIMANDA